MSFASSLTSDVEFSPEDAGRSEEDFLCRILEAVIDAGARTLNIPDTVGYSIPQQFGATIANLINRIPNSESRHEGLSARTVKLKLRWADFTTLTRQTTLVNPTNLDEEIFSAAQYLFSKVWINNKPVRLLGIGASNFCLPV